MHIETYKQTDMEKGIIAIIENFLGARWSHRPINLLASLYNRLTDSEETDFFLRKKIIDLDEFLSREDIITLLQNYDDVKDYCITKEKQDSAALRETETFFATQNRCCLISSITGNYIDDSYKNKYNNFMAEAEKEFLKEINEEKVTSAPVMPKDMKLKYLNNVIIYDGRRSTSTTTEKIEKRRLLEEVEKNGWARPRNNNTYDLSVRNGFLLTMTVQNDQEENTIEKFLKFKEQNQIDIYLMILRSMKLSQQYPETQTIRKDWENKNCRDLDEVLSKSRKWLRDTLKDTDFESATQYLKVVAEDKYYKINIDPDAVDLSEDDEYNKIYASQVGGY